MVMLCKNLDVFVLTYNRSDYLKMQLESLCNQTAQGFTIKILDNASTDNTGDVIKGTQRKYPQRKIIHIKHETNIGNPANFKKSQELATNEYTAVFHDDDVIHPEYIEKAMALFKKHNDVVMISCRPQIFKDFKPDLWKKIKNTYLLFKPTNICLASLLVGMPCFASMIYKTDIYTSVSYHPKQYGKIFDAPFLLDIGLKGASILMQGRYIQYRVHANSDTSTPVDKLFFNEIIAVVKHFNNKLTGYHFTKPFLIYTRALSIYQWARGANISKSDFEKECIKNELFNQKHVVIMHNYLLKKIINRLIKITRYFYILKTRRKF